MSDRVVPLAQDLVLLLAAPDQEQLVEWSLRGKRTNRFPTSPRSRALRRLGGVKGEHHDEFDAVGPARDTEDWVTSAE